MRAGICRSSWLLYSETWDWKFCWESMVWRLNWYMTPRLVFVLVYLKTVSTTCAASPSGWSTTMKPLVVSSDMHICESTVTGDGDCGVSSSLGGGDDDFCCCWSEEVVACKQHIEWQWWRSYQQVVVCVLLRWCVQVPPKQSRDAAQQRSRRMRRVVKEVGREGRKTKIKQYKRV